MGQLSPSLGAVFFRKLIAALMSHQSRKRNCRRLRRSLLFCIGFARERAIKCEAAEIGEASLTVCDHMSRQIWRAMPSQSRRRFLEHARPWWDIHRHRMAPEVETKIRALQESGEVDAKRDGASVSIRPRASEVEVRLDVSRIVSCRGLTSDPRRSSNPLVTQLVAEGYARVDPLGIGLDVDNDCAVVDARGRASERIFAVGPMSQAAFWEAIAVPDIRLQAALLARRLTEQARFSAEAT